MKGLVQHQWVYPKCFELQPPQEFIEHLYTQLRLEPSDIHSSLHSYCVWAFYSLEVTFSMHVDPLNIPYPQFPWVLMLQTSHKCPCSYPINIWDSHQTLSLSSFPTWLSIEERNGHPVQCHQSFSTAEPGHDYTGFILWVNQHPWSSLSPHCWKSHHDGKGLMLQIGNLNG